MNKFFVPLYLSWCASLLQVVSEVCRSRYSEKIMTRGGRKLEIWICERDPKTAKEAASLIEVFTSTRKGNKSTYLSWETHYAKPSKPSGGEEDSGQVQARNPSSS